MTSDEYARLQDMWIEVNGIKVGSRVKVTRKTKNFESGWGTGWTEDMDATVGKVGCVRWVGKDDNGGIYIEINNYGRACYPFFVLAPAEAPKPEKYQFKPFEQMLVRDCDADNWHINLFERIVNDREGFCFRCIDGCFWVQGIPYAGHEHLLGAADEPEDWAKYYDKK